MKFGSDELFPSAMTRRHSIEMLAATTATAVGLTGCWKPPTSDLELVFPEDDWETAKPETMGFDSAALDSAIDFLAHEAGEEPWHCVVTRYGRLVADKHGNKQAKDRYSMASLCKSVYTSMLGIAINDGKIGGIDNKLIDYYPEVQGATGEFGPYPDGGRFFSEEDREVTFRHLATHTGGFMRSDEAPGTAWTYDTFGMSVLMHSIAKQYGHYDSKNPDPKARRGDGELIAEKIRDPIGAGWKWKYSNFTNHPPEALKLFGNYVNLKMNARQDLARLGLLWLANGQWKDQQIIPSDWHANSIRVAPIIKQCAPKEDWKYGVGFWVNEFGQLWPNLPRDSYMAVGYPNLKIWICPSLSLVIVASPGLAKQKKFEDTVKDSRFLERVVDAVQP